MKEVKDYRNLFQKVSENLDNALNKNAQVNKNKPADVVEAENFLAATRSCYQHTTLDYVNSLTMLQAKKKPDILSTLLSYVQACSTYYHQGSDLCEDYDPFFKGLGDEVGNHVLVAIINCFHCISPHRSARCEQSTMHWKRRCRIDTLQ